MAHYIVKRVAAAVLVLFFVSLIVFSGIRLIPGNVCAIIVGSPDADEQVCNAINEDLGLDEPAATQYLKYMGNVLQGDFGRTFRDNRDVLGEIKDRLPLTIELTLMSTIFAMVLAVPIGVISAVKQDGWIDYVLRLLTIGWLSVPGFWLGTMLVVFPAKWWGYSTPVGYEHIWDDPWKNIQQLYLPAIALGLALSASLARITRSAMLEVLRQDYIRTARAKGLAERGVVIRHALRNASIPVVTLFGLQFGVLFGGTVVLENIFNLPGLGLLTFQAVVLKEYSEIQAVVLVFATFLVTINLLVDLSYAWIDPRIRYS